MSEWHNDYPRPVDHAWYWTRAPRGPEDNRPGKYAYEIIHVCHDVAVLPDTSPEQWIAEVVGVLGWIVLGENVDEDGECEEMLREVQWCHDPIPQPQE